jgi:DNA-binding transcriptional regulator PaaX
MIENRIEIISQKHDKLYKMIKQIPDRKLFTPAALKRWDSIDPLIQDKLLHNVWCGSCRKAVYINIESAIIERKDLVLMGTCAECGGLVARVIEGE